MDTLEEIASRTGHGILTADGTSVGGETSAEKGKYGREMHRTARSYQAFLKNHGIYFIQWFGHAPNKIAKKLAKHGIEFPMRWGDSHYKFLNKNLYAVGARRFETNPRIYAARVYMHAHPTKNFILSNGSGWGMSENIDGFMRDHNLTRAQAFKYLWTEETSNMVRQKYSESETAQTLYTWFKHCSSKAADPHVKASYNKLAKVAYQRYAAHCRDEGKTIDVILEGGDDHGHGDHDGHDHGKDHSCHGHGDAHGSHGHGDSHSHEDGGGHGHGDPYDQRKRFDKNRQMSAKNASKYTSRQQSKYQSKQYKSNTISHKSPQNSYKK